MRKGVLLPPYTTEEALLEAVRYEVLPLGAIAVLHLDGHESHDLISATVEALPLHVPPVLLLPDLPDGTAPPILASTRQVVCLASDPPPLIEEVLTAVNNRPAPTPDQIAAWLAARLDNPHLEPLVIHALDGKGRPTPAGLSGRNLRRKIPDLLKCRVSDLGRLSGLATRRRLCPSVETLAKDHAPRTTPGHLRDHVRALGVSLAEYNNMPGWEWPLEAAVRQGLGVGGWGLGVGGWPKVARKTPGRRARA